MAQGFAAAFEEAVLRIELAFAEAVEEVLESAKTHLEEFAPVGREGNSTNPPGDLKDSMVIEGPVGGDGVFTGSVGPTAVSAWDGVTEYGHFRDVGGTLIAHNDSGLMTFTIDGNIYRKSIVVQEGAHYVAAAYEATEPEVDDIVARYLAEAIEE